MEESNSAKPPPSIPKCGIKMYVKTIVATTFATIIGIWERKQRAAVIPNPRNTHMEVTEASITITTNRFT